MRQNRKICNKIIIQKMSRNKYKLARINKRISLTLIRVLLQIQVKKIYQEKEEHVDKIQNMNQNHSSPLLQPLKRRETTLHFLMKKKSKNNLILMMSLAQIHNLMLQMNSLLIWIQNHPLKTKIQILKMSIAMKNKKI